MSLKRAFAAQAAQTAPKSKASPKERREKKVKATPAVREGKEEVKGDAAVREGKEDAAPASGDEKDSQPRAELTCDNWLPPASISELLVRFLEAGKHTDWYVDAVDDPVYAERKQRGIQLSFNTPNDLVNTHGVSFRSMALFQNMGSRNGEWEARAWLRGTSYVKAVSVAARWISSGRQSTPERALFNMMEKLGATKNCDTCLKVSADMIPASPTCTSCAIHKMLFAHLDEKDERRNLAFFKCVVCHDELPKIRLVSKGYSLQRFPYCDPACKVTEKICDDCAVKKMLVTCPLCRKHLEEATDDDDED